MLDVKDVLVLGLLLFCLVRELVYIMTVHKLINKLMSKNYHDYMFSQNVEKTLQNDSQAGLQKGMQDELAMKEDLGPLTEFSGLM